MHVSKKKKADREFILFEIWGGNGRESYGFVRNLACYDIFGETSRGTDAGQVRESAAIGGRAKGLWNALLLIVQSVEAIELCISPS